MFAFIGLWSKSGDCYSYHGQHFHRVNARSHSARNRACPQSKYTQIRRPFNVQEWWFKKWGRSVWSLARWRNVFRITDDNKVERCVRSKTLVRCRSTRERAKDISNKTKWPRLFASPCSQKAD